MRGNTSVQAAGAGDGDFEEIWCVFDRDDHPHVNSALQEARDHGIRVAFSNPCFELWLVLHVEDQTAHVDRDRIQKRCIELGLTDGKAVRPDALPTLKAGYEDAKRRAQQLAATHKRDGASPRSNPSSDVWRLVDRLRGENNAK